MRQIIAVSVKNRDRVVLQSSSTTYGELKAELITNGLDTNGLEAKVRETRNTLGSDDSVLPDGGFTLILTPTQVKSGNDSFDIEAAIAALKTKVKEMFL